jgi:hypothetical protein
MSIEVKLSEYAKELGIEALDFLTIDALIDSHRSMRQAIRSDQELWLSMLEKARQDARQQVMDSTWVRIDDLKKMQVRELVALLVDE